MADNESQTESNRAKARIAVRTETRDLVKSQKRGGETYDDLLKKMAAQYSPAVGEIEEYTVPLHVPDTDEGWDETVRAVSPDQAIQIAIMRHDDAPVTPDVSSTFIRKNGLGPDGEE